MSESSKRLGTYKQIQKYPITRKFVESVLKISGIKILPPMTEKTDLLRRENPILQTAVNAGWRNGCCQKIK
jgi:hypothetical protein